jgi:hypothetical protein
MDKSAALLERAQKVAVCNEEIDALIAELQSISIEPALIPSPPRALPWLLAPALAVAFAAGVWAGAVAMAWGAA